MRRAWHFVRSVDGAPALRDGRPVPPIGEWLDHGGQTTICVSGLHASDRAFDALAYCDWDNAIACLVEVDGVGKEHADKFVARRRRVVGMVACDDVLRVFAREAALSVLHLWPEAPAIVREYLETGREDIRAAARAAAGDAAGAAARAAAGDAAWDAARAAAGDAARAAAGDAAWAAARAAAGDAAWDAAGAAAWDAAGDAKIDDLNHVLESLLIGAMRAEGQDVP